MWEHAVVCVAYAVPCEGGGSGLGGPCTCGEGKGADKGKGVRGIQKQT